MKEFDSIRIVDKGGDSLSFEMTGNVAGSPYDTIVFLLRATSGLIAASAKDSADPQKVADVFCKVIRQAYCAGYPGRAGPPGGERRGGRGTV